MSNFELLSQNYTPNTKGEADHDSGELLDSRDIGQPIDQSIIFT